MLIELPGHAMLVNVLEEMKSLGSGDVEVIFFSFLAEKNESFTNI